MLPVGVVHSHITIKWVGKGSTSKMYQEWQATKHSIHKCFSAVVYSNVNQKFSVK